MTAVSEISFWKLSFIARSTTDIIINCTDIYHFASVNSGPNRAASDCRRWKKLITQCHKGQIAKWCSTVKPGFHYPSSWPELTARELRYIFWRPSWRPELTSVKKCTGVDSPSTRVVETGLKRCCLAVGWWYKVEHCRLGGPCESVCRIWWCLYCRDVND